MGMRVCYLDWHEAGLCCYLVIHIGNTLHPLQLFYFHLWPVYWLSLVHRRLSVNNDNKNKGKETSLYLKREVGQCLNRPACVEYSFEH
jgi:hypothetical protein